MRAPKNDGRSNVYRYEMSTRTTKMVGIRVMRMGMCVCVCLCERQWTQPLHVLVCVHSSVKRRRETKKKKTESKLTASIRIHAIHGKSTQYVRKTIERSAWKYQKVFVSLCNRRRRRGHRNSRSKFIVFFCFRSKSGSAHGNVLIVSCQNKET